MAAACPLKLTCRFRVGFRVGGELGSGVETDCLMRHLRPPPPSPCLPGVLERTVPGLPRLPVQKLLRPVQWPWGAWGFGVKETVRHAQGEPGWTEGRGLELARICGPRVDPQSWRWWRLWTHRLGLLPSACVTAKDTWT